MVNVYDWLINGESIGCGTELELAHCVAENVYAPGEVTLGAVLCEEPASEDARRAAAWAKPAKMAA